jgi:hypothetical protein
MFTDNALRKYIESISVELSSAISGILPLYRYGYILKKEELDEIKVHRGFRNTIERYIENRESLTKKELLCILGLYSLEYPELSPIIPPQIERLLFAPNPQVELDFDTVLTYLSFTPNPQIIIDVSGFPATINFVPVPQITGPEGITVLSFVPAPQINPIDGEEKGTGNTIITYVPIPIIEFEPGTVIPEYPELTYAPHPIVGNPSILLVDLDYIPNPMITMTHSIPSGDMIYWGVIERSSSDPRPVAADFDFMDSGISRITLEGTVPANMSLAFDHEKYGYMIFAYPESANDRITYIDPNGFKGYIGGPAVGMGNLWPNPEIKFNDSINIPKNYKVYITSFWTRPIRGSYTLRDTTFMEFIS